MNFGIHICAGTAFAALLLGGATAAAEDHEMSAVSDHREPARLDAPVLSTEIRVIDDYEPRLVALVESERSGEMVVVEREGSLAPWPDASIARAATSEFRVIESEPRLAQMPASK